MQAAGLACRALEDDIAHSEQETEAHVVQLHRLKVDISLRRLELLSSRQFETLAHATAASLKQAFDAKSSEWAEQALLLQPPLACPSLGSSGILGGAVALSQAASYLLERSDEVDGLQLEIAAHRHEAAAAAARHAGQVLEAAELSASLIAQQTTCKGSEGELMRLVQAVGELTNQVTETKSITTAITGKLQSAMRRDAQLQSDRYTATEAYRAARSKYERVTGNPLPTKLVIPGI